MAGDIHDIGKDIVTFMLDVSGYDVLDIGIDVPVDVFVEKIKGVQSPGRRTLRFPHPRLRLHEEDRRGLEEAGLRKTKIMIGGGQMDDEIKKYVKADAYGKDAIAAVNLCREWIGG